MEIATTTESVMEGVNYVTLKQARMRLIKIKSVCALLLLLLLVWLAICIS